LTIGVISDTHGILDNDVLDFFGPCNEIWHAGDIGDIQIINKLASNRPVKAVYGNIDGQAVRKSIPENQIFSIGKQSILITHIAGSPPRYNQRVKRLIRENNPSIVVCGHSHILKVLFDHDNNLLFINPGAAGNQGFHKIKTSLRFQINNGNPEKMEVFEWERYKKRPLSR